MVPEVSSAIVPFAANVDKVPLKRLRGKQHVVHGFGKAWSGYVRGHVASRPSVRTIVQALMQMPWDSKEADLEEPAEKEETSAEALPADGEPVFSAGDVRQLLRECASSKITTSGHASQRMQKSICLGHTLWGSAFSMPADADGNQTVNHPVPAERGANFLHEGLCAAAGFQGCASAEQREKEVVPNRHQGSSRSVAVADRARSRKARCAAVSRN